ncbi:MAG TPA: hypothetical protein VFC19_08525 [Candidatus Limnocylindrales bacterium]|nr:hypothetical protein [Candidatus Limnocylindrales bacterium]
MDLLHLKDVRDGINRDADDALRPGIADANGRIYRGLTIGATSQSGELDASRRALAYAMGQFYGNSQVHLERAQHVINFLDRVLEDYQTADDFAAMDVNAVLARLAEAAPPRPAPGPDRGGYVA